MELDVMFKAWSDHAQDVTDKLDRLAIRKPLHKQALSGAVQIGAVAPTLALLEIQPHVPIARIWNVLSVSIYSADAHTPVAPGSLFASGTAAAPVANTNVSGLTNNANQNTTYTLNYTVSVSGTAAVADANNFKINYGATAIFTPIDNPEPGSLSGTLQYNTGAAAAAAFSIRTIGAATAGTVYGAQIQAVPASGPGILQCSR